MGAVGLQHVLTVTNDELQAHTRTGVRLGAVSHRTFWQATNSLSPFDPRVVYDRANQRFIVVALDHAGTDESSVLIAVSQSSNLLGGWVMMRYLACTPSYPCGATGKERYADFPMVGFNRNWLSVNYGMLARTGFPSVFDNRSLVVSYPALLTAPGQPPPATVFMLGQGSPGFWGIPVVSYSATENDLYFFVNGSNARLNRLTGSPDAPVFVQGPTVALPSHLTQFGSGPRAPQPPEPGTGSVATVDIFCSFGGANAVFRDDHVWVVQGGFLPAGSSTGHLAVAWAKVHKSGTFVDGGLIDDATGRYFNCPSIAVNQFHDVLIGFTQSSPSEYYSAAYAFRAGSDPPGTMRDPHVYRAGDGFFNLPHGSGVNRWGDYSQTIVDPSDDTTLWTIQEYARAPNGTGPGSGRWGTWWAAVNNRGPQPPGAPGNLQASSSGSSVLLSWAAPVTGDPPTSYTIEAGSAPGASDLANFPTGNTALSFAAAGVPNGTYHLRVRASNSIGTSSPSNEVTLTVGCTAAPGAPVLSVVQNSGGVVTLAWSGTTGAPTRFFIEAGTGPGLSNLASLDLGPSVTITANLGAGTYYVRVRGSNQCGIGAASNEVVLVVP
jgi:hypothetical protein